MNKRATAGRRFPGEPLDRHPAFVTLLVARDLEEPGHRAGVCPLMTARLTTGGTRRRERLDESCSMMEPFPERPKGMHHDTYMRLFWEHHEAEMEQLIGARKWLDKLEKKVG